MTALLAAAAALIVALLGLFGVMIGHLYGRVGRLEGEVKSERDYSNALWAYTRYLLDLYFKHRQDGAPDPREIPERKN